MYSFFPDVFSQGGPFSWSILRGCCSENHVAGEAHRAAFVGAAKSYRWFPPGSLGFIRSARQTLEINFKLRLSELSCNTKI